MISANRIEALIVDKKDLIKKSENTRVPQNGSFKMPIT